MAQCESCGKNILKPIKTIIENVELGVCEGCTKYGRVVPEKIAIVQPYKKFGSMPIQNTRRPTPRIEEGTVEKVISDAPNVIKRLRESKGMRQIDLAKMLQVKESLIHHVESKQIPLSVELAKKIEEAFDIKLVKKFKEE